MKLFNKTIISTLIGTGLLGSAFIAQASSNDKKETEVISFTESTISIDKALEIALTTVPGKAKAVEFDNEHGKSVWEVEVVDANKLIHELEIDAASGKVLKQKLDYKD